MPRQKEEHLLRKVFLMGFVASLVNSYSPPQKEEVKPEEKEEVFYPSIKQSKINVLPRKLMQRLPSMPMQLPQLPMPRQLRSGERPESVNLGKITRFLLDPTVQSVECSGPDKNLQVNKSGIIQTTSIILTKEDIDLVMNEISNKTRIPVTVGLFKAAIQDLLVTAVVSDFVGTRFIIQKRMPFQNY